MQKKLIGTTALALLLSIAPFNAQASMRADDDRKVMVKPSKPVLTAQEEAKDMLTSTEYLLKSFEEAPVVARNNGQHQRRAVDPVDPNADQPGGHGQHQRRAVEFDALNQMLVKLDIPALTPEQYAGLHPELVDRTARVVGAMGNLNLADLNQVAGRLGVPALTGDELLELNVAIVARIVAAHGGNQLEANNTAIRNAINALRAPAEEPNDNGDADVENNPLVRAMGDLNLADLNQVVEGLNLPALTAEELLELDVAIVERIVAAFRGQVPQDGMGDNNAQITVAVNALRAPAEEPNDNGGDGDDEGQERPQRRRVDA